MKPRWLLAAGSLPSTLSELRRYHPIHVETVRPHRNLWPTDVAAYVQTIDAQHLGGGTTMKLLNDDQLQLNEGREDLLLGYIHRREAWWPPMEDFIDELTICSVDLYEYLADTCERMEDYAQPEADEPAGP